MVDGEFVVNPTLAQRQASTLHLVVSGTKEAIMMVEAGAQEVPEDVVLDAIMFAHEEIKKIIVFIDEIIAEIGKPKMAVNLYKVPEEIDQAVREYAEGKMRTDAVGPSQGISEIASATDEPIMATISGEQSGSTLITVATTCTSLKNPLGKRGLKGLSISLELRTALSLGLPSLLINPPGIFPAAYIFSS